MANAYTVLLAIFAGVIWLVVTLAKKSGYNQAKTEQTEADNVKLKEQQAAASQPITPSDAYDELRKG